jgi:AcrR family transcriptional regulator
MTDKPDFGPLPWWQDAPGRRAARAERRRQRHDERDARRDARATPPPREPVTLERVGDAALRVVDAEGLDALTVRRLAQELGVGTMTLYWYVQNKDEVLDLVADRMMADVRLPAADADWRQAIRDVATAVREAMLRHANAVPVMLSRGSLGPNGLGLIDSGLGVFKAAGFDVAGAAEAYFTVANFVLGSSAAQLSTYNPPGRPDVPRPAYGQMLREYIASLPAAKYPNLQAAAPLVFGPQAEDRFAVGLETIIDGLARKLATSEAVAEQPAGQ